MTPVRRAEWIPSGRRQRHPSDVAAGRWAAGCGVPLLLPVVGILLYVLEVKGGEWWVPLLCAGSPIAFFGLAPLWMGSRRDARAFADLGEREPDMAEVSVTLHRYGAFLGTDQGYLWEDGDGTAFQGERLAFRLPGGALLKVRDDDHRYTARDEDGVGVEVHAVGSGIIRVAKKTAPGGFTRPPLVRDPEMRPPALSWRLAVTAGLVCAGGFLASFFGWPLALYLMPVLSAPVLLWLCVVWRPVWTERRSRRDVAWVSDR